MLTPLSIYYNRFTDYFSNQMSNIWKDHIYIESITGRSDVYTSPANYKYFFYIFYSIKAKMTFNSGYGWTDVLVDYDVEDIVKKMYCHNIKFKTFLDIFEIPVVTEDGLNILVTIDRIYFTLRDGDEFIQTYKD